MLNIVQMLCSMQAVLSPKVPDIAPLPRIATSNAYRAPLDLRHRRAVASLAREIAHDRTTGRWSPQAGVVQRCFTFRPYSPNVFIQYTKYRELPTMYDRMSSPSHSRIRDVLRMIHQQSTP